MAGFSDLLAKAVLLGACLALTACQTSMVLAVDSDAQMPRITINPDQLSPPCIGWWMVADASRNGNIPLWEVRYDGAGECAPLRSFTYGVLPPGYVELGPVLPIPEGSTLRIAAGDVASRDSVEIFPLTTGGGITVRFEDGEWKDLSGRH